ncbi:hypothetical protein [Cerasicoccus frondis]|uniref:hypothetical protein n=1 Tax=Cerasicoccus frondis TaxID=490090 RepID=UPI002852D6B4|nr:hypothetical protein [Cerasicoccus frondis]
MKMRQLFQRMTSREKTLLVAFVWVILIIVFSFALRDFRVFVDGWQSTGRVLKDQKALLDQAPETNAALDKELEFYNSDRIFDLASLTGRVDQLAKQAGITNFTFNTGSEDQDIHVAHTMRLNVRDTPIDKLMALDEALNRESPYINKVSVSLKSDRNNSELLDATIVLNSFELKPSGLTAN